MSRLSKEDWINAALEYLSEKGSVGISVVKIAERLQVTRGSFYYHFKNLNDMIDEMVQRWEETIIDKGFNEARTQSASADEEVRNLIDFVSRLTDKQDLMFRQWAPHNEHVRQHMERLDQKRLGIMTEVFQRLARNEEKGASFAKIAFYGYIGCLNSYPRPSAKKQKEVALEIFNLFQQDITR